MQDTHTPPKHEDVTTHRGQYVDVRICITLTCVCLATTPTLFTYLIPSFLPFPPPFHGRRQRLLLHLWTPKGVSFRPSSIFIPLTCYLDGTYRCASNDAPPATRRERWQVLYALCIIILSWFFFSFINKNLPKSFKRSKFLRATNNKKLKLVQPSLCTRCQLQQAVPFLDIRERAMGKRREWSRSRWRWRVGPALTL